MKFFLSNPVSPRVAPTEERAPTAPVKLSSRPGSAHPSAPTISVPPVDHLIHLEFGRTGLEVSEVDHTIPGDLYDELFKR